jgi:hypothetical protein
MVWKDFLFGVAATFSAELLLAAIILVTALLRAGHKSGKLLRAAAKPPGKKRND